MLGGQSAASYALTLACQPFVSIKNKNKNRAGLEQPCSKWDYTRENGVKQSEIRDKLAKECLEPTKMSAPTLYISKRPP